MSVDIQLRNVMASEDSIEGDIVIRVSLLHLSVNRIEHFRVLKNSQQTFDLGGGVSVRATITHEPPASVCVAGQIVDRLGSVDFPKSCVAVQPPASSP